MSQVGVRLGHLAPLAGRGRSRRLRV